MIEIIAIKQEQKNKLLIYNNNNNSIQDYLYSAFYNTIISKQLYRKLSFHDIFRYYRNLTYLTYGKIR